jgi:hypothetical protein
LSFKNIKHKLAHHLTNIPGWRTKRKIVVIESDDWGSIRMPSAEVYQKCLSAGYPVDLNPYERYDSLASKEDIELLFELLTSFKDKNGNHPVITANCVVANPDFNRIKEDNYQQYHYELISETFKRYPEHSQNLALWKEGNEKKVFHPQFHAREHLNVSKFMKALQENDPDVHFGFSHQMPGSIRKGKERNGNYFVEATHYSSEQDKTEKLNIYMVGLNLFEEIFGYKSQSVIPPNYTWNAAYDKPTKEIGVKYLQGIRKMREPVPGSKPHFSNRFLGKKNASGQIALVRNVTFEPTLINNKDTVERCLTEIGIAFLMKKPAIISSHRINYVGFIDKKNRDTNLNLLKEVIKNALKRWPDAEFMTSDALGMYIE